MWIIGSASDQGWTESAFLSITLEFAFPDLRNWILLNWIFILVDCVFAILIGYMSFLSSFPDVARKPITIISFQAQLGPGPPCSVLLSNGISFLSWNAGWTSQVNIYGCRDPTLITLLELLAQIHYKNFSRCPIHYTVFVQHLHLRPIICSLHLSYWFVDASLERSPVNPLVLFSLIHFYRQWTILMSWLSLLHKFIHYSQNLGSAYVQILLTAYRQFAMERISGNDLNWMYGSKLFCWSTISHDKFLIISSPHSLWFP